MFQKLLCKLGWHGPNWFGPKWGRCNEAFVRQCPYCGIRWYGKKIEATQHGILYRSIGDWKTREQCIKDGEWRGDKFPGQKILRNQNETQPE